MRRVTIVGGGIAGLTLGILLRRAGVPVCLHEAGDYPRHRVCGEYISGAGTGVLKRLELRDSLIQAGARPARTVRFLSRGSPARTWASPRPALCVTRYQLDQFLASQFTRLGGELLARSRWSGTFEAEGVVRATGRRPAKISGWRWIGIKAHALEDRSGADLEMHFGTSAYAGIARLGQNKVNICGLLRAREPVRNLESAWIGILESLIGWHGTEWDHSSFRAVAGFSFAMPEPASRECHLGDAISMMPPLTGNGMSAALESAELASAPLNKYARGEISWETAREEIRHGCNSQFLERFRWARLVQELVFTRMGQFLLRGLVTRCDWVLPLLFRRTR